MRTEEEIRKKYEKFLKDNPTDWVYNPRVDETVKAWYQGCKATFEFVLSESEATND